MRNDSYCQKWRQLLQGLLISCFVRIYIPFTFRGVKRVEYTEDDEAVETQMFIKKTHGGWIKWKMKEEKEKVGRRTKENNNKNKTEQNASKPQLCQQPHSHLQRNVGPVDAVVSDIKVERWCLLDTSEWDGHVVVVGLQRDAPDVRVAREEQESLRNNACPHVGDELQANGTATLHTLWLVEAQGTAEAIIFCTRVGTWGGWGNKRVSFSLHDCNLSCLLC